MTLRVEDYLDIAHDGRKFRDLRRTLRGLPEADRCAFIMDFLRVQPENAWWLANTCMRDPALVERILRVSIEEVSPRRIKAMLVRLLPRLGTRRVTRVLSEYVDTRPDVVDAALYALKWLVDMSNEASSQAMDRLTQQAEAAGFVRGSQKIVVPPT